MPVNADNLYSLIQAAWRRALNLSKGIDPDGGPPKRSKEWWVHSQRAKKWVESLGKEFKKEYNDPENARVFWDGNTENKGDFCLQEMLFDVAVCEISTVESVTLEKPLPFFTRCHWQIESELNQGNSRAIVIDMSKLVMGSSENKLFVASHKLKGDSTDSEWESGILEMCKKIAQCCDGKLFFCFIAHPKDWDNESVPAPSIYRWINGNWVQQLLCGIRVDSFLGHTLKGALHSDPSSGTSPAQQQ